MRKPEFALVVDLHHFHFDLSARAEEIGEFGTPIVTCFGHVNEAFDTTGVGKSHEHTPLHDLADDAFVDAARCDLAERTVAGLARIFIEHALTRHDDVAALLGVLRDDEVVAFTDHARQVRAMTQVDV